MLEEKLKDKKAVSEVVSKAVVRAADDLGLNGSQLALIVGLSEATVSRVRRGSCLISASGKTYELALMLIRTHQSLMKINAGNVAQVRTWMQSPSRELKAVPAEKIRDIQGLVTVSTYASMRAANL